VTSQLSATGYVRVSTGEQVASGAGLEAQRQAIRAEVARRNWILTGIFEDRGVSGKSIRSRPGLSAALNSVESGEAFALVVSKLDRLSRSVMDFASMMERSRRKGWALVALDLGIDTTTASGEMMATVVATFAQYERRLIGQRTKAALAIKRQQGVRLGRPSTTATSVITRARRLYRTGYSFARIANTFNEQGVPTAQGGAKWHPSTIRKLLLRLGALPGAARAVEKPRDH